MDEKVIKFFENLKIEFADARDELEKLDSVGGDGDLGIVLRDGFADIADYVKTIDKDDLGKVFYFVGKRLNQIASSSMGTLLSNGFITIGKQLKGKTVLGKEELVVLVKGMAEGIQNLGKAQEGEKTILDSIFPAARAMEANVDKSEVEMLEQSLEACKKGIEVCKGLVAKQGRLAYRAEASIGITDPGSVAAYHYVNALYQTIKG